MLQTTSMKHKARLSFIKFDNFGIKHFYSKKNVTSSGAWPDYHWFKSVRVMQLMNKFCCSPFADWLKRNDMDCLFRCSPF